MIPPLFFGFLGMFSVLWLERRRRQFRLREFFYRPVLSTFDVLSPAVALGLALGLSATLYPLALSKGVLPLRSPVTVAFLFCFVIFLVTWFEGGKEIQFQRPSGLVFAEWLFLTGLGLTADVVIFRGTFGSIGSSVLILSGVAVLLGIGLITSVVPPFVNKYEGLRILERVAKTKQHPQPEYTPATEECPQPQLWTMFDSQTTELEVLDFLKVLVTTFKPKLMVETGTFLGHGTAMLAEGARLNGFGRVITIELDPDIHAKAMDYLEVLGLSEWVEGRLGSSLDTEIRGTIDLLFSDSHLKNREAEIRRLLPQLSPRGILLIHDASSHFKVVREAALRMEREGLISVVLLPTPRGLVIAQKREGRR